MDFYFPTEFGEQVAFVAACATIVIGLLLLALPGRAARLYGMGPVEGRREGYATLRAFGGFFVGAGLSAIMLAQPTIYMALGGAFLVAAFGRLLSVLFDRAISLVNLATLLVELLLAAMLLAYVFQII